MFMQNSPGNMILNYTVLGATIYVLQNETILYKLILLYTKGKETWNVTRIKKLKLYKGRGITIKVRK